MDVNYWYLLAADALLVLHTLFVAFVVFGLLIILLGACRQWHWIRNFWFRLLHVAAIGFVVVQSWLGAMCPLTLWEMALREKAGGAVYAGSFIAHWLGELLYYQAEPWVFVVAYTIFGLLVVGSWYFFPPRRKYRHKD